jgi:ubiquinone/menaquinone biosynthesis C-methylase UbiE
MSQAQETAARFDRISGIYDETREPLTQEAIEKAALILSNDGCRRILEVGVGTGRIAKPLLQLNFEITGLDLSRRMLAIAHQKGVNDLVMGDANRAPFLDKTFDAVVLAHVLHLLEDPAETFTKLAGVAKKEIVVFVRRRDPSAGDGSVPMEVDENSVLRQTFRKVADEMGYALPTRLGDWRSRFRKEIEFLSSNPPSELITIQDIQVVTTVGERLSFFEKRAYGYPSDIPEDVFHKVLERVKSTVDMDKEIRYRRVEQMAIWRLPH